MSELPLRQLTDHTVGVVGIIPCRNTVLVLRRSATESFLPGAFDLPGGGLEPGESPEEGIRREVLEETGLSASVVRRLGDKDYRSEPKLKARKSLIVYLLKPTDERFQVILSREHDEYQWITHADLGRVFDPGDLMGEILREYFESNLMVSP